MLSSHVISQIILSDGHCCLINPVQGVSPPHPPNVTLVCLREAYSNLNNFIRKERGQKLNKNFRKRPEAPMHPSINTIVKVEEMNGRG